MTFQYEPLGQNQIRLLKRVSRDKESASFKLIHVSILSKPKYTALSYTWNNLLESSRTITVNGRDFPVRANLHDALKQMLESGLVRRYLWVDAICINQGEDQDATDERSLQVSRMAEIYDQATEIVVWLGKPENHMNNRLACQMLAQFERHYYEVANRAAPIWERITPCLNSRLPDVAKRRAMFIQSLFPFTDRAIFDEPGTTIHNAWLGVAAIFSSRWWTRTWVYQESTVPERRTAFSVGTWTIKPGKSRVKFL
ncbi:hypothetical protein N8I77_003967 [Diaporthe amygdali]|uniref:Heterokaryon incompatibility domain-containing protein n=1 Tax=Phomopsis amygdali TaxID=1214568 RepID=A0AAD9SK07_PHOAM|nr:hypothetical protein N8I77_003967 [Diaporthe amygdali]